MNDAKKIKLPKIYPVACHTDNIGPDSTFVVIKGDASDGISFLLLALEKGARTVVIEEAVVLKESDKELLKIFQAKLLRVPNARRALAELSAQAHNYPARSLKIIGITGTKGKTTTAFLMAHILEKLGFKVAITSTVHNAIAGQIFPTALTTCHPDYLHMFLDQCLKEGVDYVVMEAAAQGFSLQRLYGIEFDAAIFTNFEQEHAEFYKNLDDYFSAKKHLFAQCKINAPKIINADDTWVKKLCQEFKTISCSLKEAADYTSHIYQEQPFLEFALHHEAENIMITSSMLGKFNAYNCTLVLALCDQLGFDMKACGNALKNPPRIPGRLEGYSLPNGARCFVDYAHTPSSYESLLSTLKQLTDHLIVVFGCGGGRDPIKRPIMGKIAAKYADLIFLTMDNPRFEDPLKIIEDIKEGIPVKDQSKVLIDLDREKAIRKACHNAKYSSIVAVLGKGPDHFQKIKGHSFYFNDSEVVQELCHPLQKCC